MNINQAGNSITVAAHERKAITDFIKSRANAARNSARLPKSEAEHLARCFDTLADDIAAGLHEEGA